MQFFWKWVLFVFTVTWNLKWGEGKVGKARKELELAWRERIKFVLK